MPKKRRTSADKADPGPATSRLARDRAGKSIIPLTVKEILEDQLAQKLA